jgi:hypothetical protein
MPLAYVGEELSFDMKWGTRAIIWGPFYGMLLLETVRAVLNRGRREMTGENHAEQKDNPQKGGEES